MITAPRSLRIAASAFAALLVASAISVLPTVSAVADTSPPAGTPSTVSSDALPTVQVDGVVWTQIVVGNTVYVGGQFTTATPAGQTSGGVARSNMLAYDIRTGVLISSFAPSFNAQVRGLAVSADGSTVYAVGYFTSVNGVAKYRIAAIDATTGALKTAFKATADSPVSSIAVSGSRVYLGGQFTSVDSTQRGRAAAVDAATGALLPWAPVVADNIVRALVVSPDGSKVVLGGSFSSLNGNTRPGTGLGAVDATTGASLPWNVGIDVYAQAPNAQIMSLTSDATSVYGTGYVYGAQGTLEGTFKASWTDGTTQWIEDCHGDTYSAVPFGDAVYVASHSHFCGEVPGGFDETNPRSYQHALAFTKATTGTLGHWPNNDQYHDWGGSPAPTLLTWYPDFTIGTYTGQSQAAWSVAAGSGYVVYGGEFPSVNGTRQTGLVRFGTTSNAPNTDGPRLAGNTWVPSAVSVQPGSVRVAWPANWDRDNELLTYTVYRNGGTTPVYTTQGISHNRSLLPTFGFIDTGLTPGATVTYRIRATDPFGNFTQSSIATATVTTATSSAYSNAVIADGASDFWRFGEAGGSTVYDWAGYRDLTVASGVAFGTSGAIAGDANTSATFAGAGSAATTQAVTAPDTYTSEAWFRTTSTTGGKILGYGNAVTGDSSGYDRQIYMDSSGRVIFGVYPDYVATVQSDAGYNDGAWHQVVASLGANGMRLSVDGVLVAATASVTRGQAYSGYWRVGGDNLNGWPGDRTSTSFTGDIDDIAIYPTTLSASTVRSHFQLAGRSTVPVPTDAYGAQVLNDSPAIYWRLDDAAGSTSAADISGRNNTGSAQNGTTLGTTGAPAGPGTSATFDGSDDQIVATKQTSNPQVYSEELWFNTTTTRGGKLIGFGDAASGRSSHYDRHVWMLDTGQLTFGTYTGQLNLATSTASYNDGGWHQLVATQGGDGLKLYVDGKLVATNAATSAEGYDGYWRIGGDTAWGGNSSDWFAGRIDEVAVYSDALTAAQVAAHYSLGSGSANQAPTASFTATTTALSAAFDGSASSDSDGTLASYAWDFGDNSTGTGVSPTHAYTAAGAYQVTLTVTDDKGATASVVKTVTVAAANQAPKAAFTSTSTGLTAAFDASGSTDADGTVASYAWNFGDGATATGVTASHTYASAGTFTVTLTVTDDKGATNAIPHDVVVSPANVAPTAAFTATSTGLTAAFDGTGSSDSDGSVASYAWSFGDGQTGTGSRPAHAYASAGTYSVALTVTDDKGATGVVAKSVVISAANVAPTAAFTATSTGLTGAFDGTGSSDSDGSVAAYAWTFGDGGTATGSTPSHAYASAGTYTVRLTVTDDKGATGTVTRDVTVAALPASGVIATDGFGRTVTGGLGTADTGGAWTLGGTASRFSVGDGVAKLSTAANGQLSGYLNSTSAVGTDAAVDISLSALPVGGASYSGVVVRRIGSSDYSARVAVQPSGAVNVELLRGSTSLKALRVTGITVTPGSVLHLRVQAIGTNPTTLQARVWTGTSEPTTWQVTTTDASAALQAAGAVGIRTNAASAVTNGPIVTSFDSLSVKAPGAPAVDNPPTAAFTATASGLVVSADGTASTDAEGAIASYAWDFGDGGTATGSTASHTYATAGDKTVRLTVTDSAGQTGSVTKTVTVTAPPVGGPLAKDAFGRTTANGFGTADTGGVWTLAGTASRFSVADGKGVQSTAAGVQLSAYLNSISVTDVDSQVTITVPAVPVGGSLSSGVVVRRIGSTDYSARLTVNTSGTVNVELLRGSTSLQTVRVQGLTAAAGSVIHLRVRAIGTAPTTLQARAWADGATEPTTWQATATDTTAALQAAGGIGVRSYAGTGLTNGPLAVRFDDLLVAAP